MIRVVASLSIVGLALAFQMMTSTAAPKDAPKSLFAPSADKVEAASKETPNPDQHDVRRTRRYSDTTTKTDLQPYVMRLDVETKANEQLEEAYYDYLSKNRVHPKVLCKQTPLTKCEPP